MKRLLTLVFAFVLTSSMMGFAQYGSDNSSNQSGNQSSQDKKATKAEKKEAKAEKKEAKAAEKGKSMRLTGWIKTENDKPVFVNDKDKQTWNIANPDAVQGHDGHHVKVKAKLNESDHSVNIESLKMLRKGKQSGDMKNGKGQ
jgi:hypothetical protein